MLGKTVFIFSLFVGPIIVGTYVNIFGPGLDAILALVVAIFVSIYLSSKMG